MGLSLKEYATISGNVQLFPLAVFNHNKNMQKVPPTPALIPGDWFGPNAAQVAAAKKQADATAVSQQGIIDTQTYEKYAVYIVVGIAAVVVLVHAFRKKAT